MPNGDCFSFIQRTLYLPENICYLLARLSTKRAEQPLNEEEKATLIQGIVSNYVKNDGKYNYFKKSKEMRKR
jgi:hypothetical protein